MKLRLKRKLHLKELESLQYAGKKLVNIARVSSYSLLPAVIVFELTKRCNLRCKMCNQASQRTKLVSRYKELSLEEWEKIIDDIDNSFFFKPRIHLTGGEPLLYPGILELVEYIKKRHFKCSITTNGLILPKKAEAFVNLGVNNINVSIDGPEKIHDFVRGVPSSFTRAMEGIKLLEKIRKANPRICINCVISGYTYDHLEETIKAIQDSGADALSFQHLIFSEEDLSEEFYQVNVDCLVDEISRIEKNNYNIPIIFYPKVKIQDLEGYYTDLSYDFGDICVAPWFIMRIRPNGDVQPCLDYTCGNIRTELSHSRCSLASIWNNTKFRNFIN